MDVLNSDFRCKWPSKNNFSELDISQSLVWQCPSLSPYFLLVRPHNRAKNLEVQYFKVVSITMKLILIFAFVSSFGILTLLAEKISTVTL